MQIDEPLAAYYLDRAVMAFGSRLELELEKSEQGKKSDTQRAMARGMVLNRWLGVTAFADPRKAQRRG